MVTSTPTMPEDMELSCLKSIAKSLALLASSVKPPNYRRKLADLMDFPWNTIAARIVGKNGAFVTEVEWNNHRFVARKSTPNDKKGEAVWYSRKVGDSWERLITFKDYENGEND
jgi:hypothetical protein